MRTEAVYRQQDTDRPLTGAEQGAKQVARLALIGAVGVAWFLVSVVLLHFLRPEYNPRTHMISDYAVGRYGAIQTANFFALGIGAVALAVGLARGRGGRIGPALIALFGALAFLSGIFRTDLEGAPQTTTGTIHEIIGIAAFVLVTIGILVCSWQFRSDAAWRSFAPVTLVWGLAALGTFFLVPLLGESGQGVGQRIFLAVVVSWLLTTALRLRNSAASTRTTATAG
jgi:hypothetical membrane protein